MTEPLNRETTNPARPIGSVGDVVEDVADEPTEARNRERLRELPDHESDADATVGGGVMSEGGTAVDRGTGMLTGQAEGTPPEDDDPLSGPDDEPEKVQPSPLTQR